MAKQILVKPLVTEKTDILNDAGKYVFVVNKKANKIEIGKAVAKMYDVKVKSVNTMIMPGKTKSRNTRSGVLRGTVGGHKKAIVTLQDGDVIEFLGGTETN